MDHTGQENIWFAGCLTTARATPALREGGGDAKFISGPFKLEFRISSGCLLDSQFSR